MKKLLQILLIFTGCAMRAQQSFPGVNITPNGGAAGKINLRNSANVNKMFIQESTLDASGALAMTFTGPTSPTTNSFIFNGAPGLVTFCNPGGGAWEVTRIKIIGHDATCTGNINVQMTNSTGAIETSSGLGFYENANLGGDVIGLRAPAGAVTASYTINLPGTAPSVAGQALAWVSGSTYAWTSSMTNPMTTTGDLIYSSDNSGTPARRGIGTAGQCLVVTAGLPAWGSCSSGASPFIDTTAILYSAATPANTWTVTLAGLTGARTATPPNADFTMAGVNITQTFTADQTLSADLLAGANTRKLGNGTPFYQVQANRFEGSCSLCSSTTNYMLSRKLSLYDQGGTTDVGWDAMVTYSGGVNSWWEFRDNAGASTLRLQRLSFTGDPNVAIFDLDLMRGSTARNIGSAATPWTSGYLANLRVTSLGTTGTRCVQTDDDGDLSQAAAACGSGSSPFIDTTAILYSAATPANTLTESLAGLTAARTWTIPDFNMVPAATNHTQTFSADQTIDADVIAASNTRKLGTSTPFYQVVANRIEGSCSGCSSTTNYVATRQLDLFNYSGVNDLKWSLQSYSVVATSSFLKFRDDAAGTEPFIITTYAGGVAIDNATFMLDLIPDGTRTVGEAATPWSYGYFTNARAAALAGVGTRPACVDSNGTFTVTGCGGSGTVTSVGQSFTGGLISVAGSPITTSGTLALTVAGTSGGVPYFSSSSTWASSAALTANLPIFGGGAGAAPFSGTRSGNTTQVVTTTGTQTSGDCVKIDASGNHVAQGYSCNPMTSAGDIISATFTGTPVRVAAGTNGQILNMNCIGSCIPQWITFSGTSPISYSAGAISCTTCITTAGGQTISGTTTLSTAAVTTLTVSTTATINTLLTVNGGNVDIDSGQTFSVNGSFFGQDYTGGINVGTSTLFFKSGILYACTGTC